MLQQLSRFDLLGARAVSGRMPFCPPIGSRGDGLGPVVGHALVSIMGLVIGVLSEAGVAAGRS